jgi:site-specific recombinase XerD
MKPKELLQDFINYLKSKKKSENTITNYNSDLIQFIDYLNIHNISITEVKRRHIESYLGTIEGVASTINRKISSIQKFFKYLKNVAEVINDNPADGIERLELPKRQPVYLQIDESKKLLNSIEGENFERDKAIITIFLHCGLRLSELVGIDIDHITDDMLSVIGKGNKQRPVPLDDECIKVINEYLKVRPNVTREKALFLSERKQRISERAVQRLVKRCIEEAGLDIKKYSTHKLRSSCATLLSKGGVPIQEIQQILGHSNINTTTIYVGVEKESLKKAVNANPLNN